MTAPQPLAPPPPVGLGLRCLEVVWLVLLFFVFAGLAPPDVGESHYLTKAKHYWDPQWCAGDLFLESADAHLAFYWTIGWITRFCSLATTAWVSRILVWTLLAWSWRRLSAALTPQPFASVLSAALFLVGLKYGHMAGEWVVGGVEAKGPAYALVFLALEAWIQSRTRHAFWLAGAAAAFHVLVGGWLVVILAANELLLGRRPLFRTDLLLGLAGAGILALPGLLPALLLGKGGGGEESSAAVIYVYQRLSHHLVFHRFGPWFWFRHALLLALWSVLAWRQWGDLRLRRLHGVVLGAVGLAVVGVVIDQGLLYQQELAARFLRFYWFRLSDAFVPLGAALGGVSAVLALRSDSPQYPRSLTVAIAIAVAGISAVVLARREQPLPGAWNQPHPFAELRAGSDASAAAAIHELTISSRRPRLPDSPAAQFQDWRDACRWISENTPANAKFITPKRQQTFKWFAGRAEVVNWKDVPQDSAGLAAWNAAYRELYPPLTARIDLAAHSDAELIAFAHKYGAGWILLDAARSPRPLRIQRLYPPPGEFSSYEVYQVPAVSVAP